MDMVAELNSLVSSFGLNGLFAAFIVSILIWFFAHFHAAPGTIVNILWGLVSYTKKDNITHASLKTEQAELTVGVAASSGTIETPRQNEETTIRKGKIVAHYGISEISLEELRNNIRLGKNLRQLRPADNSMPLSDTPPGTYFFVFFGYGSFSNDKLGVFSANRLDHPKDMMFEMHRDISGELFLLAFVSDDNGRLIERDRAPNAGFIATPCLWKEYNCLVEIEMISIKSWQQRIVQPDDGIAIYGAAISLV